MTIRANRSRTFSGWLFFFFFNTRSMRDQSPEGVKRLGRATNKNEEFGILTSVVRVSVAESKLRYLPGSLSSAQ